MPELPEVETIVRGLAPRVTGACIRDAECSCARILSGDLSRIVGRTIARVVRHGKFIVFDLGGDSRLTIHLGMTGKLLVDGERTPYTRAAFLLDRGELLYDDIRTFGRLEVTSGLPARVEALGPDALTIGAEEFVAVVRRHRGRIKPLLLNQRFLGGLGNIYVDESLFAAGIHPLAVAARLTRLRLMRLHECIRQTLGIAIEHGGSSISDYVDSGGRRGGFQELHAVYGREGEPCRACGTPVRRIVVAQRGTHLCPRCQKR